MQTVLLKPLHHRGQEVIGIYFKKDAELNLAVRTTERYLQVSKKQLVNIVSPLDDLWQRGKIEW